MTYSDLHALVEEAGCSPEEFGEIVGIAGMTLRRWFKKSLTTEIPKLYLPAIREACFTLIAAGRLQADSERSRIFTEGAQSQQYKAVLQNLGIAEGFHSSSASGASADSQSSQEGVLLGLSKIGAQEQKQSQVNENEKNLFNFKRLGEEWSSRITRLWDVIHRNDLTAIDKLVAYGALFYLLTPIDFIPDSIPLFGLLDDFGVLGIAVAYYNKRFATPA